VPEPGPELVAPLGLLLRGHQGQLPSGSLVLWLVHLLKLSTPTLQRLRPEKRARKGGDAKAEASRADLISRRVAMVYRLCDRDALGGPRLKEGNVKTIFMLIAMTVTAAVPIPGRFNYDGNIDDAFVRFLEKLPTDATVQISSRGGFSDDAIAAAEIIERRRLHLSVGEVGASACVDYLFPVAKSVTFLPTSIVAMHGNSILTYEMFNERGFGRFSICSYVDAYKLRSIWQRHGVREDAWRETVQRLGIAGVRKTYNGQCGQIVFERDFWVPTSDQLREMYGNRIIGQVCADDPVCVRTRIAYRWPDTPLVVGDEQMQLPSPW